MISYFSIITQHIPSVLEKMCAIDTSGRHREWRNRYLGGIWRSAIDTKGVTGWGAIHTKRVQGGAPLILREYLEV